MPPAFTLVPPPQLPVSGLSDLFAAARRGADFEVSRWWADDRAHRERDCAAPRALGWDSSYAALVDIHGFPPCAACVPPSTLGPVSVELEARALHDVVRSSESVTPEVVEDLNARWRALRAHGSVWVTVTDRVAAAAAQVTVSGWSVPEARRCGWFAFGELADLDLAARVRLPKTSIWATRGGVWAALTDTFGAATLGGTWVSVSPSQDPGEFVAAAAALAVAASWETPLLASVVTGICAAPGNG